MTSRTATRAAVVLDALIGLIWGAGVVLILANRPDYFDGNAAFLIGLFGATAAAYAVAGTLIARQQPSNPIAWLCFEIAVFLVYGTTATEYAVYALRADPGSLPAPDVALALAEPTPMLFIVGLIVVLYVFPTGRTTSRVWRLAMWITVLAGITGATFILFTPHAVVDVWAGRLGDIGLTVRSPFGVQALRGQGGLLYIPGVTIALGAFTGAASLFARRRRADAQTREQLRWLAYVVGFAAAWIAVMIPLANVAKNPIVDGVFWFVTTFLFTLGLPLAIGIAIVRYRLFDIDVVINKTFVFGTLAAFITLVYVAIVVGIGQLVGETGNTALSILATAIVAVTFQPVRTRVQRVANRLVYGKRATPYEVLSEFSERIGGTYAAEELLPRMAQILAQGTGATEAAVWIEESGRLRMDTSWPSDAHRHAEAAEVGEIESNGADLAVPVRHLGEVLGALSIRKRPGEPVSATERALVDDLAAQAGLVLRNVRLIEELRASRRRIVAAQDERAKKLERDIHDGAQQQLVALAVKQRLAASLIGKDDQALRTMLEGLQAETTEALDNLRDLARGIYPPLLADKGLAEALTAQARKASIPVHVESDGIGRYPQEIESALYFCCLEALQNVAKYANASRVDVRLSESADELTFEVKDDGQGFDASTAKRGSGLQGMADRLEAVGGSLEVSSSTGTGTTVTGRVPVTGGGGVSELDPGPRGTQFPPHGAL
jgi:signal transduction histidine kinase